MDGKRGSFYLATMATIFAAIFFLLPAFSVIADDDYTPTTRAPSLDPISGTTIPREGSAPIAPPTIPSQVNGTNCTTILSNYRSAQSSLARAQRENNLQSIASIKKYLADNLGKYDRCKAASSTPTTIPISANFSSACLKLNGTVKPGYCVLPSGTICGESSVMKDNCPPKPIETTIQQVACTMDAKICPDGSAVGRVGPKCEFAPCPVNDSQGGPSKKEIPCAEIKSKITSAYGMYQNAYRQNNTAEIERLKAAIKELEAKYSSCVGDVREVPNQPIPRVNVTKIAPTKEACEGILAEIRSLKETLLASDEALSEKGLNRATLEKELYALTKKLSDCRGVSETDLKKIVPTPCGEAKGLAENVLYLKKLLALTDEELAEKGLTREDVEKKFEAADSAYNKAMYNCVEKREEAPVAIVNPCVDASKAEQRLLYLKKMLLMNDSALAERNITRESVKEKLGEIETAYPEIVEKCKSKEACSPAPGLMREYEELVEKLKDAEESGDSALAKDLTEKIIALKRKISESADCQIRQETSESSEDSSGNYRKKLEEISLDSDASSQLEKLKELKKEIERRIEELLKEKQEVDSEELSGLAKIEVSKEGLKVNDNSISRTALTARIRALVNNREATIVESNGTVSIEDGSEIATEVDLPIVVEDGRILVGGKEVKVLPGELAAKLRNAPENVELSEDGDRLVYLAKAKEKRKLFFLIPVEVEVTEKVDAESGENAGESSPFWAFLAARAG